MPLAQQPENYIHKPFGFSYFPLELLPAPRSWVELTGDLVFWREHTKVRLSTYTTQKRLMRMLIFRVGGPFCRTGMSSRACRRYSRIRRTGLAEMIGWQMRKRTERGFPLSLEVYYFERCPVSKHATTAAITPPFNYITPPNYVATVICQQIIG